jgi:membrane protein DedA with SNARE-associated domain
VHPAVTQLQVFLEQYGTLVAFAIGLAEFGGLPIASAPLLVAMGAFVATGALHPVPTVLMAALGGLTGDSLWYGLARWRGRRLLDLGCGLSSHPQACVLKVDARIRRIGPAFLIPAKLLPGTSNLTAVASGMGGVSAGRFAAYSAVGLLLWAGGYVLIGAIFADQIAVVLDWITQFLGWAVALGGALIVTAAAWRLVKIRMHRKRHRDANSMPAPRWRVPVALASVAALGVVAVLVALPTVGAGPPIDDPESCEELDHAHPAWAGVLDAHVKNGLVDYGPLHATGSPTLNSYLQALGSVCREGYDTWSRAQRLAFWINAYNAYTVRLVLDHYPIDSIRSVGTVPGAAFRKRFIEMPWYQRRRLSLDDIEHRILRERFDEPRIHFALVCAARGCPELPGRPFLAPTLDEQLDDAGRAFLRDPKKNRFDPNTRTLHLSPIFQWFREDFERGGTDLPAFVAPYLPSSTATAIRSGDVRVEFLGYDWSLNRR